MNLYFDKKKNKRLISFLYNSNLLTGVSFNENLELIINPTNNNPSQFIDGRINLAGLDEMSSIVEKIIKNSVTAIINKQQLLQNGLLLTVIGYISTRYINNNTPLTESNVADVITRELMQFFYKNTLKDDDFNWISINNQRIINFVWASLRNSYLYPAKNNITINFDLEYGLSNRAKTAYQIMNLEINPPNLESKLECVKLFFDSWGEPLPNQKQLMESIKNRWDNIKNRSEIIDWLNKNEELTTWAWSYIVENMLNKSTPEWVNISSQEIRETEQQTKNTIITMYDLLVRESDRKLLKSQLSRNGAQQKYRIKEKSNTRVLNLNISIETKSNLEKLKKIKNKSMKEIIENLINEELDRMSNCR